MLDRAGLHIYSNVLSATYGRIAVDVVNIGSRQVANELAFPLRRAR